MEQFLVFALNIGAALAMGIAIGLERQFRQRTAGLRTNALVCVGSALFVSASTILDRENSVTRIAGQVASGIGFLGGGVILREGLNVRGMNTAATLWCSAAVGTLAGLGLAAEAALGTAAVLFVHIGLRPVVRRMDAYLRTAPGVETLYRVRVVCEKDREGVIRSIFLRHVNSQPGMALHGLSAEEAAAGDLRTVLADIFSAERDDRYLNDLVSRMSIEPGVSAARWERAEG
jgi:putative Mg2+ transporter-C (MgtC) family protein